MKLAAFIKKDVRYDNESPKAMIAMRFLYIVMFCTLILDIVLTGGSVFASYGIALGVMLAVNVLLFIQTYYAHTRTAILCFNIYVVVVAYLLTPCFGWHAGLQNYLIILVMLFFFGTHRILVQKVLYSIILFVYRALLSVLYGGSQGTAVTIVPNLVFEAVNIAAIFTTVIIFSYLYSRENTEAEQKLILYNEQLKTEANTDPLTGLYNRRYTYELLQRMQKTSEVTNISLAMGDIDFFKNVNDTYGHEAGDEVLKAIAEVMLEYASGNVMIARWGGEEFLLVFLGINGDNAYVTLWEIFRKIAKLKVRSGDNEISVTMTFGLTEFDFSLDADYSIKHADDNLYRGKNNGRNQIVY